MLASAGAVALRGDRAVHGRSPRGRSREHLLDAAGVIEVVGEACNGLEAVGLARSLAPDVVLMDVRMPELDGIAAAREIITHAGRTGRGC